MVSHTHINLNAISWLVHVVLYVQDAFFASKELLSNSGRLSPEGQPARLWIPLGRGEFERIDSKEVIYVRAKDHELTIHTTESRTHVIKSSLQEFYARSLSKFRVFYQNSRSLIVNLDCVHKIEQNQLVLIDGTSLHIPKNRKEEVLKVIGAKS